MDSHVRTFGFGRPLLEIGQCDAQTDSSDPYLPLRELLGGLTRQTSTRSRPAAALPGP